MKEHEPRQEELFWTVDEALCELPLTHGGEPTSYGVRIKAHLDRSTYRSDRELYPLDAERGTKVDLMARAYVLVPAITLTVDLSRDSLPAADWRGMRHEELARMRALYYLDDRALAIWEIDDVDRLDLVSRLTLWQGFERFLTEHYPGATHIYTDDAEPGENEADNRDFLGSLGYGPVAGPRGLFAKELSAPHP